MTLITYGSFPDGKMSEFKDTSQNAFPPWAVTAKSDLKAGAYKAKFKAGPGIPTMTWDKDKCYRVHALGGQASNFLKAGTTFFRGLSLRWTISPTTTWAGDEIHASGGTPLGDGPAPLNGAWCEGGNWNWIVRGGGNPNTRGSYKQHDFGPRGQRWQGLSEKINVGEWLHTVVGMHFAPDSSGWFEMWACHDGGVMVNVVPRIKIPTCFPAPIGHYAMMSCYHSSDGVWHEMEFAAGAYADTLKEIQEFQNGQLEHNPWADVPDVPPPPPPPPPPPTGVKARCTIQQDDDVKAQKQHVGCTVSQGNVDAVEYYFDNVKVGYATDPIGGFVAEIDLTGKTLGDHKFGFVCLDKGVVVLDTWKAYPIKVVKGDPPPVHEMTNEEHADAAWEALTHTTDPYKKWEARTAEAKKGTNWQKAKDHIDAIKDTP
jgi:hypothetical protein